MKINLSGTQYTLANNLLLKLGEVAVLFPTQPKQKSAVLFLLPALQSLKKGKNKHFWVLVLITFTSLVVHSSNKDLNGSTLWNAFDKVMIGFWLLVNLRRAIKLNVFHNLCSGTSKGAMYLKVATVCAGGVFVCNHIRQRVTDKSHAVVSNTRVHQLMHFLGAAGTYMLLATRTADCC
jgi:hypothetical protein